MSRHRAAPHRQHHSLVPVAIALVGAMGLVGGLGTQAYWNDTETVSGTTITSGSLDLEVGGQDSYTWSGLSVLDLAPGEAHAATVTLTNAGTTPFTVDATASASGTLAGYLTYRVTTDGAASTTPVYPRTASCSGTQSYSGLLGTGTGVLTSSRAVPAGGSLVLCVSVTLSPSTPSSEQGKTTSPSFAFTATQAAS